MAWGGLGGSGSWRMHAALRRQAAIACIVWAVALCVLATAYALPTGPDAVLKVTDAAPFVGQTIRFDASGSVAHDSGNGAIVAYRFGFGDGSETGWQTSAYADHAYAAPGNVSANVTVVDGRGLEDSASVELEVRPLRPSVATPDLIPVQLTFVPIAPRVGEPIIASVVVLNGGNETATSAVVRFLDVDPDGTVAWIGNVSMAAALGPSARASVPSPTFVAEADGNHTVRAVVTDVTPAQATGDHEIRAILDVLAAGGGPSGLGQPPGLPAAALGLAIAGAAALAVGWLLLRPRPPGPLEPPPEAPQDRSPPPLWPP